MTRTVKDKQTIYSSPALSQASADTRYKLATLPVTSYWAGKTMWTYGHSYLGELAGLGDPAYVNSAADYYSNLLTAALGVTKVKRAEPGSQVEQVSKQAIYDVYAWTSATDGIVLLESMINSIRTNGTSSLGYASATNALRTLLAIFTSSARYEQTNTSVFTYGSGWSDSVSAGAYTSSGSTKFSTAQNAYVDITLPANSTGVYYLLTIVRQSSGPTLQVQDMTAGGTVLSTTDLSAMTIATPAGNVATPTATNSNSGVIKIQAPAGHVVRVTRTDSNGVAAHIDALLPQSATPPLTVVVKEQNLNATGWASGGGTDYHAGSDAACAAYAAICDSVAAEFSNVITSDASPYWNSATCLGTDNVHPNTLGYIALYQGVMDALATYLTSLKIQKTDLNASVQASLTKADGSVQQSANLSDIGIPSTARTNLGLGTASTKDTGNTANQIPVLSATPGTPDGTKFLRDDGTWQTASGGATTPSLRSVTTSTTVANTDDYLRVTGTGSGVVLTLHSAATATAKKYHLKNASSGTITFATTSSQTVDGSTTGNIVPNQSLDVFPDGTNWIIV